MAAPLAFLLDLGLGDELATTYSNAEMMKLLQIHVQENVLDKETAGAMTGALTYKNVTVKEVMTPIERTFMLNVDEKLSFETIAKIFRTGFSRIPVYEVSHNNVIGILFVKDLIFIDPEDEVPLRGFIQIFGRGVHVVWPDDKLGDVLAELKKGRSHLALVRDVNNQDDTQDPFYEVKGIITLEDIIEKIIGDEIVDETDAFVDNSQSIRVERGEGFEWARLRILDSKITDEHLSESEAKAVTAHLRMNHSETFQLLTDAQLLRLVSQTPVSQLPTATREIGNDLPSDCLYEKGVHSDVCTLILAGKVTILVGTDNFRSDVSSWAVLAASALVNPQYNPDFTAYVSSGPCRCLCLSRNDFASAVDASTLERRLDSENKMAKAAHALPPEPKLMESLEKDNNVQQPALGPSSRRDKLIAAIHLFKRDGNTRESNNDHRMDSEAEVPVSPKSSSVEFKDGGVLHSSSIRRVDAGDTPDAKPSQQSAAEATIEGEKDPKSPPNDDNTYNA